MAKKVKVEVTDKNAVYINQTRITGRDTKWGIHYTLFSTKAFPKDVVKVLTENGYGHLKLDKDYAAEFGIII